MPSYDEQLLEDCENLLNWGKHYTYHWLWGATLLKKRKSSVRNQIDNSESPSIDTTLTLYSSNASIEFLREQANKYDSYNFLSRFFIRLFNWSNLFQHRILYAFYETKTYLTSLAKEVVLNINSLKKEKLSDLLIEQGQSLEKHISILGLITAKPWKTIAAHLYLFSSNRPAAVNGDKLQDRNIEVHTDEQVKALKTLGINCGIGGSYLESKLNKAWRQLAIQRHSDKGGEDHLFREISQAREILNRHTRVEKNHSGYIVVTDKPSDICRRYEHTCSEYLSDAKKSLDNIVESFISRAAHYNTSNYSILEEERKSLDTQIDSIITLYKSLRTQLLASHLDNIKNFGRPALSYSRSLNPNFEKNEIDDIGIEASILKLYRDSEIFDADISAFRRGASLEVDTKAAPCQSTDTPWSENKDSVVNSSVIGISLFRAKYVNKTRDIPSSKQFGII